MNAFEIIKFGSNFLKEKKIPSFILDSEILLSKILNKTRENMLINLDQNIYGIKKMRSGKIRSKCQLLSNFQLLLMIEFSKFTLFL